MSRIRVNVTAITALNAQMRTMVNRSSGIRQAFIKVWGLLDRRIFGRRGIGARHDAITREIEELEREFGSFQSFVNNAMAQYTEADTRIKKGIGGLKWKLSIFRGENWCEPPPLDTSRLDLDETSYMAVIEQWISEELGLEPGVLSMLLLVFAADPNHVSGIDIHQRHISQDLRSFFDNFVEGGSEYLFEKYWGYKDKIIRQLSELESRLQHGNPNQLAAIELLRDRFTNPTSYLTERVVRESYEMWRDMIITQGITSVVSGGIIKLAQLATVGGSLLTAWKVYSTAEKIIKVADVFDIINNPGTTPQDLRDARDYILAELSLNVTLYNDLLTNSEATPAETESKYHQLIDSTFVLLKIELKIERELERSLENQLEFSPWNRSDSPFSESLAPLPPIERKEQQLYASRQRQELLQRHLNAVERLHTERPLPSTVTDTVLRGAISVMG